MENREYHRYRFEKLEVWQLAKDLVKDVYLCTKLFPAEEKYGLVSQLNRAVLSVSSNIAEGASRKSSKDQGHFYQMAYSSLMEVLSQLVIAKELDFLSEENYISLRSRIDTIAPRLSALHNKAVECLELREEKR